MKQTLRYSILVILILFNINMIFSQESNAIIQLSTKRLLNNQRPPLDSLLENAKNGPI